MTTHSFTTVFFTRSLAAAALLAGLAAGAQTVTPAPTTAATATTSAPAQVAAARLTIREIYDRLEAAGYRDMLEIEWSDGRYEVKGRNAQGARVKLDVDGTTGAVLRERNKR